MNAYIFEFWIITFYCLVQASSNFLTNELKWLQERIKELIAEAYSLKNIDGNEVIVVTVVQILPFLLIGEENGMIKSVITSKQLFWIKRNFWYNGWLTGQRNALIEFHLIIWYMSMSSWYFLLQPKHFSSLQDKYHIEAFYWSPIFWQCINQYIDLNKPFDTLQDSAKE